LTTNHGQPGEHPENEGDGNAPENAHVCANCFAEFDWAPTVEGGEEFCCAGCAQGGPCACTYGAPELAESDAEEVVAERPAPGERAPEPARRHRAEVILAAVSDLPVELRSVVTLRITRDIGLPQVAEELGAPIEVVERRLEQARALLQRTLGSEYEIRYMPPSEPQAVPVIPPEAEPALAGATPPRPSLTDFISASMRAMEPLADAGRDVAEGADAQQTLQEALGEAAEIFRLASQRLGTPPEEREPLRRLLQDRPPGQVTFTVSNVPDSAGYMAALEQVPEVRTVQVQSVEDDRVTYLVDTESGSRLVRGLLGMPPRFRPRNLRLGTDSMEATLGAVLATETREMPTGPVFELGAEAFFGARHYVSMGGVDGPPHHHSFRVEVLTESSSQDENGVVIGFARARELVEEIVARYNETLLNTIPPFNEIQPTLENIAKTIYDELNPQLTGEAVRLKQVRVWESPTNHASYSEGSGG